MADKLKPVRIPRPSRRPKPTDVAYQFLVVLAGTEPLVWRRIVMYEGLSTMEPALTYPRCVGGAGSSPPEDCGGVHGFADFLRAIGNPRHPDHKAMREWSAGRFHAGAFDPAAVVFDDPKKRWQIAFANKP